MALLGSIVDWRRWLGFATRRKGYVQHWYLYTWYAIEMESEPFSVDLPLVVSV